MKAFRGILSASPLFPAHPHGARSAEGGIENGARAEQAGFTLIEIMITVAIIGLLATIALPNFIRARKAAQVKACISNLRTLDGAVSQWAIENKKTQVDTPSTGDVTPYLRGARMPECPAGGTYRLRRVGRNPACSMWSQGHTLWNVDMGVDPDPF